MENKVLKCSICNKEYQSPMARANCELACCKKLEEEKAKVEKAKKEAEQIARKTQVDEAFAVAYKLREEYIKDYGLYSYVHKDAEAHDWPTVGDIFKIFM